MDMDMPITIESYTLLAVSIISLLSLLLVPRNSIHTAVMAYITFKTTTWVWVIINVQYDQFAFPVHVFKNSTSVGIITQFILFPTIFMWFYLFFPKKKSWVHKVYYYLFFVIGIQLFSIYTIAFTSLMTFVPPKDLKTAKDFLLAFILPIYSWPIQFFISQVITNWFLRPLLAKEKFL